MHVQISLYVLERVYLTNVVSNSIGRLKLYREFDSHIIVVLKLHVVNQTCPFEPIDR